MRPLFHIILLVTGITSLGSCELFFLKEKPLADHGVKLDSSALEKNGDTSSFMDSQGNLKQDSVKFKKRIIEKNTRLPG